MKAVQVYGLVLVGMPVQPAEEQLNGVIDSGLCLKQVGEGIARGEVPAQLDLGCRVRLAHGVPEAPVGEMHDLVPVALAQRREEDLLERIWMAHADFVRGNTDKVAMFLVEAN